MSLSFGNDPTIILKILQRHCGLHIYECVRLAKGVGIDNNRNLILNSCIVYIRETKNVVHRRGCLPFQQLRLDVRINEGQLRQDVRPQNAIGLTGNRKGALIHPVRIVN